MDKDKAKLLRVRISAALKKVEIGLDVQISVGGITYTDSGFKVQLTGVDSVPGADNFLEAEFLSKCGRYNLKPKNLGMKINVSGEVHKIIGLKVRNRKYPIITENLNNRKQYKLSAFVVQNALDGKG